MVPSVCWPAGSLGLRNEVSYKKSRNVTILFYLEANTTFREIKEPMIPWLQSNNMWMERNYFKSKTIRKAKIGWILGRHSKTSYRDNVKHHIETEMDTLITKIPKEQRTTYFRRFIRDFDDSSHTPRVEVLIHDSKPKWTVNNKQY